MTLLNIFLLEMNFEIHYWITSSSYILHASKISRKSKLNSYAINKLFKL